MDRQVSKADRVARLASVWDEDVTLSLLRAVPFRISNLDLIHFEPRTQAMDVLSCPRGDIPHSYADWNARLSPEDARARENAMRRLTWDGAEYKLCYAWQTPQGEQIWIEESGRRRSGIKDKPSEIEGVIRNVTQQKRDDARATFLARHDELTEIANQDELTRALEHLATLTQRQGGEGSFLRLRLTNLKDINDVYGYETGDRVLKDFARRVSQIMRTPDVVGRIESADFGLVLYDTSEEDVTAIADRLALLLENAPIQTAQGPLFAELAIGSTQMRIHANSASEALAQSQIALNRAGSDKLCVYEAAMAVKDISQSRETTAQDILDALNQRRIQLAFQPILEAKTSQLHHYECLLRLRREDGELVSAGRFIMAAERLGLVHLLDRRALELASEAFLRDPDIYLALNVSAGTVKDERTASEYIMALKALGPRAEQITLELTETFALDDPAKASAFSNDARALGCSFAIDDFGSGYTTFQNLMAIEADTIKIDGTLIQGIATDHNKQTFIRIMVDLAQTFGVNTVAEMVDDRADADILRRLGVDYLQGFMFGVPSAAPSWQKRAS